MQYKLIAKPTFTHAGILTVYAEDGYPADFQIRKVSSFDGTSHHYRDSDGQRYETVAQFAEAKIQEIA